MLFAVNKMSEKRKSVEQRHDGEVDKKKRVAAQRFRKGYTLAFPCIRPSSVGDSYAFCDTCKLNFNVAHGGMSDVKRHVSSAKHKQVGNAAHITNFFGVPPRDDTSAIRSEVMFTTFLVEHNIAMSAADHANKLFKNIFPKDAEKYACGRTKSTSIIKCLATEAVQNIAGHMKQRPFIIGTDGCKRATMNNNN